MQKTIRQASEKRTEKNETLNNYRHQVTLQRGGTIFSPLAVSEMTARCMAGV